MRAKSGIVILAVFLVIGSIAVIKSRENRIAQRLTPPPAVQEGVIPATSSVESEADNFTLGAGEYTYTLSIHGTERQYITFVPASYDKNKKTPLVLLFHGGGGSMGQAARDYGMKEKATKEGFIVVFPNGDSRFPRGKLATWNAGNCCGYARDNKIDDVGFVREVIKDIESKFNVASGQIFATGMSNGGMMSHRLACEMSDVFKAVASVAGTDGTLTCRPFQPIAVLHIHAKDDTHVLFDGGAGTDAFQDLSQVADFTSVPETISRWVTRNQMNAQPDRVLDTPGAYCDLYTSSTNSVQVKLCVTEIGGHSWPGTREVRGIEPSLALSANDVIWEFFKSQK